jgi:hypothetical protein
MLATSRIGFVDGWWQTINKRFILKHTFEKSFVSAIQKLRLLYQYICFKNELQFPHFWQIFFTVFSNVNLFLNFN